MSSELLAKYPLPWRVEYYERHVGVPCGVTAENGNSVMDLADFSGDGDVVNLSAPELEALVAMINATRATP